MTIDASTWQKYDFGDIARNLTTSVKDPLHKGIERYVGLEHIEPGNIHIKSWGNVVDGTTFTRVFRQGQVLFGKRRAYQRKAAIAEFDGICSGDILVFKANEKYIVSELLPFIVQSDKFFEYAIKTSAGSLSPRTKFKDLAKLKFKLPPLDEQKRLADLLWSMDEYMERQLAMRNKLILLLKSFVKYVFSSVKESVSLEKILTSDCFITQKAQSGEIPYIEIGDIDILNKEMKLKNKQAVSGSKYAKFRDIIVSRVRPTRGAISIINLEKIAISNAFTIIRSNENFNQELLFFLLAYNDHFLYYLGERSTGSTYPTVAEPDILSFKIPMIDNKNQKKLLSKLLSLKNYSNLCEANMGKIKEIKEQIINQLFGGIL